MPTATRCWRERLKKLSTVGTTPEAASAATAMRRPVCRTFLVSRARLGEINCLPVADYFDWPEKTRGRRAKCLCRDTRAFRRSCITSNGDRTLFTHAQMRSDRKASPGVDLKPAGPVRRPAWKGNARCNHAEVVPDLLADITSACTPPAQSPRAARTGSDSPLLLARRGPHPRPGT